MLDSALGQSNTRQKLVEKWLQSSRAERGLGELTGSSFSMGRQCCSGSQEGRLHPGEHQTLHNQLVNRGNHLAVFSVVVASPGILCAVLEPIILDRCEGHLMHPAEGHNASDSAGRHVL